MSVNVGIGDLAILRMEGAEDEELDEVRAVYEHISGALRSIGQPGWSEPESLPDDGWDQHADQVDSQGLAALLAHVTRAVSAESHLSAVSRGGFLVPLPLEAPVRFLLPGWILPTTVGSVAKALDELQSVRSRLGIPDEVVRLDQPELGSDARAAWNVLYYALLDSQRYRSAVRFG